MAGIDDGECPEEEGVGGRDFVNTRGLRLSLLVTRLSLRIGARVLASDETLRRLDADADAGAGAVSNDRPAGASDERPIGTSDKRPTSNETRLPASKANGARPGPEGPTRPCPCPCTEVYGEVEVEAEATVIRSDPPRTKPPRSEVKGTPEADNKGTFEAGADAKGADARSVEGTRRGPTAKGTLNPLKSRLVYSAGGDG